MKATGLFSESKKTANGDKIGLEWPELTTGILLKRYKRFMVDVRLSDGKTVTAYCPNTGSMLGCCEPGRPVYLSEHDKPGRRLRFTFEMIQMPGSLVGVNTSIPNKLIKKAIEDTEIEALSGYKNILTEVRYGQNSRIDILLEDDENNRCFIEIKNCTLVKNHIAFFPDAVTSRGLKHLKELQRLVNHKTRCIMFYLIQRTDARIFRPADHIDPAYGKALRSAARNGVKIMVYDVSIDLQKIRLNKPVPYEIVESGDLSIYKI